MNTPWEVLSSAITRMGDRIDSLPTMREASVAALSPLSVRFDTDTSTTLVRGTLAGNLLVGDRVLTTKIRHYIWIMGSRTDPVDDGGLVGEVKTVAVSAAPRGWLLCQGQSLLRADYPRLFTAIGTTYGTADSTRFSLPNLTGRVVVGLDSAQTEFNTLGEKGGAKTHVLSASEMPVHTHTQNAHNHTQNAHNHTQDAHNHTQNAHSHSGVPGKTTYVSQSGPSYGVTDASVNINTASATATNQATVATNQVTTATNQATTAVNQNTGGGLAHNNLQPYITLNYVIKF